MWAQQLLQGPQSMGNSKAAQAVPMGLLSPHLTMDPLNQPIALVSSSEVSDGKGGRGLSSRPTGRSVVNRLKGVCNGCASCLSQHLQRFLQCSTCLSHSHSLMPCTAISSPLRQVITPHSGALFPLVLFPFSTLVISHTFLPT